MDKEQHEIVRIIRQLHRDREPLNLAAVRRRQPKLLRKVYGIKPFWGWKQALAAAGLNYRDIDTDLLDSVRCEICDAELKILGTHLRRMHGSTGAEYAEEFPGAATCAETVRASIGRRNRQWEIIPHWEEIWTPEYVLDRLAELHARGYPVNAGWIASHESSLWEQARFMFKDWDEALERTGLRPEQIRLAPPRGRYPSADSVVREIQRRAAGSYPCNGGRVEKGKTRDVALTNAGLRHFGGWPKALAAAGFDAKTLLLDACRKRRTYPDKPSVLRAIRQRHRAG